jgi:peptidoglycan/LPS O-acetylase OafA/YrhL
MVDAWHGLAALGVVAYHLGFEPGSDFDLGHPCVMGLPRAPNLANPTKLARGVTCGGVSDESIRDQ